MISAYQASKLQAANALHVIDEQLRVMRGLICLNDAQVRKLQTVGEITHALFAEIVPNLSADEEARLSKAPSKRDGR